jgi:hypothetical protein
LEDALGAILPTLLFQVPKKKRSKLKNERYFYQHSHSGTLQCIHIIKFQFHDTASLELDIFEIGAKLGALLLLET